MGAHTVVRILVGPERITAMKYIMSAETNYAPETDMILEGECNRGNEPEQTNRKRT